MWHGRYDPDLTGGALAADRLHQLIGSVADVTIASRPRNLGPIPLPDEIIVTETPTATFQPNDVIVTRRSAAFYRTYGIDD